MSDAWRAGLAHEINSPLAAVLGNLELLSEELAGAAVLDGERLTRFGEMIEDARAAAEQVGAVVRKLAEPA